MKSLLLLLIIPTLAFSLPDKFDLRDSNRLTPAKKQSWGTCWAFATISSLESSYLSTNNNNPILFSEYYLDRFNGFNRNGQKEDRQNGWYSGQGPSFIGSNTDDLNSGLVVHLGGDYHVSTAFLSNRLGIVESKHFKKINSDHKSYLEFSEIKKNSKFKKYFPEHVEWLTLFGSNEEKREKIKMAIFKHGAVASAQHMKDKPITTINGMEVHLYNGDKKVNHAISIIGWDDTIKFKNNKGMWIIKDSDHVNDKGEHIGYFYVPYTDKYVAKDPLMGGVLFRNVKERKKFDIYSHALHGWRYTTSSPQIEKVKNIYKIKKNGNASAIGFYSVVENQQIEINVIYKNISFKKILDFKYPGFHLYKLPKAFKVKKNENVSIELKNLNGGGYAYDASSYIEVLLSTLPKWGQPVLVRSKASKNESFFFQKGQWIDFYDYHNKGNKQKLLTNDNSSNIALNLYVDLIE